MFHWFRKRKAQVAAARTANEASVEVDPPLALRMLRAIEAEDLETLRVLLDDGANPNGPCWDRPPLLRALQQKDLRLAQCLLDRGADPNTLNFAGLTPLLVLSNECRNAESEGSFRDRMALLREFGAIINATDTSGRTAGFFLAIWGNEGPLRAFLEFGGAYPAALSRKKMERERRFFKSVMATVRHPQEWSELRIEDVKPVLRLLRARKAEEVDYALQLGANPSDCIGADRVFCIIARGDNPEVLARMLEEGADPNMQQGSPLIEAMFYGAWRNAEVLLIFGADPDYEPPPFEIEDPMLHTSSASSIWFSKKGLTPLKFILYMYDTEKKLAMLRKAPVSDHAARVFRDRIVMVLGAGADPNRETGRESPMVIANRIDDPLLSQEMQFFGGRDP